MRGLELVPVVLNKLSGERHAVELPLPVSAIREYAGRLGLSDTFVQLVQAYDNHLLSLFSKDREKRLKQKNGRAGKTKAPQKLLPKAKP